MLKNISKDINIAANHCSDEIKESLIGNINTLTKRLEEGKSPLKTYSIVTECNLNKDNCGGYNFFVTVNSEDDPHEFYSADLTLTDDYKHNYKCIVTGKDVWTKLFKPITDKLLWDGYTHQPFSRNPEKRNIYYQLQ